jgi:hypothetical protein
MFSQALANINKELFSDDLVTLGNDQKTVGQVFDILAEVIFEMDNIK